MSVLLIAAAIASAAAWELYFDDRVNTVPVLVAARHIPQGTPVTPQDVVQVRARLDTVPSGVIWDPRALTGRSARLNIPKGMVLADSLLDDTAVVAQPGQEYVPVPGQWIYAVPGSLRRKDIVSIYAVPTSGTGAPVPGPVPVAQQVYGRPLLQDVAVAHVKDSSNREVRPVDQALPREDATGSIAQVELVLTDDQYSLLRQKALEGNKFIITYR